jgi:hypothetical protein
VLERLRLLLRDPLALDGRGDALRDLLRAEQVELLGRALLRLVLQLLEQAVERRGRRRLSGVDRRRREILLEVEELQLPGRADDLRRLVRIMDPGQLNHDLVGALDGDVRRRHTELVDAIDHHLLSGVHPVGGDLRLLVDRGCAQDDLDPAAEVETQGRLLVGGRTRNGHQQRADERSRDCAHEQEIVATFSHEGSFGFRPQTG